MLRFKIQSKVEKIAGVTDAVHAARNQLSQDLEVETLGRILGGHVAGTIYDVLEPTRASWHRDFFHASIPNFTVQNWAVTALPNILAALRTAAEQKSALRMANSDPSLRLPHAISEFVLRLLSVALIGFAVGAASHVILNLGDPRVLPLIAGWF